MNPFNLIIPLRFRTATIHRETELALLQVPVNEWTPVVISGKRVVDGVQRVLVARKHGLTNIPFREQ